MKEEEQVRQAKIKPNTVFGLVEELHIFHLGIDSGIDVRVPGTLHPAQKNMGNRMRKRSSELQSRSRRCRRCDVWR